MKNLGMKLFCFVAFFTIYISASASDFILNGICYNFLDKTAKTVEVASNHHYTHSSLSNIIIPETITYCDTTYTVTSIGEKAFYNCYKLTGDLVIPNSVTTIGEYAFYDCYNLTGDLVIPNSVTTIGEYAFYNCYNLTGDLVISDSVKTIKESAFRSCSGFSGDLIIPNSVTTIGKCAFYGCSGFSGDLIIPNSVTTIGEYAFNRCSGFSGDLIIPNSVTTIGEYAFNRCSGFSGDLIIPNSVTTIEQYTFYGCSGFSKNLKIGNSVKTIKESAFRSCSGFSGDLIIPNGVETIENRVFLDCTGFDGNLVIAPSVKTIGISAFRACTRIIGTLDIPDGITTINETTFANCNNITTINIPSSVTKIEKEAFSDCIRLNEVNYNAKNCIFNNYTPAFSRCYSLKILNIGNEVEKIPNYAFRQIANLSTLNIPNSVKEIGEYSFEYSGLRNVTLPGSVKTLGANAFYGCNKLENVELDDSLEIIGNNAFFNCSALLSITLPKMLKSIGKQAFNNTPLKNIVSLNTIPPSLNDSFNNYNTTLYVPAEKYATYYVNKNWGLFNTIKKLEVIATEISLNHSTISLPKWDSTQLVATIMPANSSISEYYLISENPEVATINQNGVLTAVGPGKTTITAKTIDGSKLSAKCEVTVLDKSSEIILSQTKLSMAVNELITLSYSIVPSFLDVQWSSSNSIVADFKVNADNSITIGGLANGVATITATATDGTSASCEVTVGTGSIDDVEADNAAIEVGRYDLYGRQLSQPTPGINIIKMSNGTIRKEIVK